MEQIVPVRFQPITPEAFEPYGAILGLKRPVFQEIDSGRPMMMMSRLQRGEKVHVVEQMAIHFSYSQIYMPLRGGFGLIVAPPPPDPTLHHTEQPIDYDRIAAFILEPGDGCLISKGTWHQIVPIGQECLFVSGTRQGSEKIYESGDLVAGPRTEKQFADGKKFAPFIEIVDFHQRDGKVVELLF